MFCCFLFFGPLITAFKDSIIFGIMKQQPSDVGRRVGNFSDTLTLVAKRFASGSSGKAGSVGEWSRYSLHDSSWTD